MITSSTTDQIVTRDEAFIARRPDDMGWMLISHSQAVRGTLTTESGPHLEGIMRAKYDGLTTIRHDDDSLELQYEGQPVMWNTDGSLLQDSQTAPLLVCTNLYGGPSPMVPLRPVRHTKLIACPTGCARINRVVLNPPLEDRALFASREDRWQYWIRERMLAFLHGMSAEVWLPDLYDREEVNGHVRLSLDGEPVTLTMQRSSGPITTLYVQEPDESVIPITVGVPLSFI